MIQSKNDLKLYLREDSRRNGNRTGIKHYIALFAGSESARVYNYLRCLRYLEYYTNVKVLPPPIQKFIKAYYRIRLNRLGLKYSIGIEVNCVGYGFRILHLVGGGGVKINAFKMGNYCTANSGVLVGNLNSQENRPVMGDYVVLQMGSKVYGKIVIGSNVIVAPNSVVFKDIPDNTVVSGIPATVITTKCNAKNQIIEGLNGSTVKY